MLEYNKIYCADCLEKMKDIDDKSIDLIVIDPPYLTTSQKWDKEEVVNDELNKELFRIAKDSASLYVWCGIGEKSQSLIRWFPVFSKDWYFKDLITWKKQRGIGMRKGWLYTREEIMWFVKDNKKFVWNKKEQYDSEKFVGERKFGFKEHKNGYKILSKYKRITNIWDNIPETSWNWKNKISHFTSKPVKTIERIIKLHTQENDIILDCFAGSGTTGIACKILKRNYILIEKEFMYCEDARKRIENIKTC